MDLLSGSWPGEVYLFRRKANGTYAAPETLKVNGRPIKIGSASALAAADWDGDGDVDLVLGNIEGAVFLITNKGTREKPSFATPEKLSAAGRPLGTEGGDAGPCIADWDGDGQLDLLVGSGVGDVKFYRNTGTKEKPELAAPVSLVKAHQRGSGAQLPDRSGVRSKPAVADWNGDGRPDLLVGDFASQGNGSKSTTHGWVWVYLRKNSAIAARVSDEPIDLGVLTLQVTSK